MTRPTKKPNREIKFRGKRIDNGEWIYGDLFHAGIKSIQIFPFDADDSYEVIPETIGQFTGLTDKNGKKIYEGDVVKYYQPYSKKWEEHIVRWDDEWACFGLFEDGNKWCKESDWVKIQEIELIGNIYENQ